jgi:hypothetical protein
MRRLEKIRRIFKIRENSIKIEKKIRDIRVICG